MANHDVDMTLERYAKEYANDPAFIAEGLSIKVIEEMLEYLEQKNLSQSWLAQQMGVSRAHISRILNAPPNMTLLTIAKFAVALGVKPDVCLSTESWRPTSVVATAADIVTWGPSSYAYVLEVKPALGTVRWDKPSAAEATEVPVRVPQRVLSAVS